MNMIGFANNTADESKKFSGVRRKLQIELSTRLMGELSSDQLHQFIYDWNKQAKSFDKTDKALTDYFREVLNMTQELCVNFSMEPNLRREIRQLTLDTFVSERPNGGDSIKPRAVSSPTEEITPNFVPDRQSQAQGSVFLSLLESISEQVDKLKGEHAVLKNYLKENNFQLPVSQYSREIIGSWCLPGRQKVTFERLVQQDMQSLFEYTYNFCCEQFGPERADIMISRAVDDADANPYAGEFSPQRFL